MEYILVALLTANNIGYDIETRFGTNKECKEAKVNLEALKGVVIVYSICTKDL